MQIRVLGVKGKDDFLKFFFHISDDSEQLLKNLKKKISAPNCLKRMINTHKKHMFLFFNHSFPFLFGLDAHFFADPDLKHWKKYSILGQL